LIVTMQKVRILGSRTRVAAVIEALQDLGVVHLCRPDLASPLAAMSLTAAHARHVAHVEAALDDVEETMARLDCASLPRVMPARTAADGLPSEVRLARRARRAAVALTGESRALEEERARLDHLTRVLAVFVELGIAASHTYLLSRSLSGARRGRWSPPAGTFGVRRRHLRTLHRASDGR
jgi:vacuolar-type H+-ATPase subunit I/STV1